MTTLVNLVLAFGLVLSSGSQLRSLTPVIGPAEMLLLLWLVLTLGRQAGRLASPLTWPLRCLLVFWTVFALSLGLGLLVGLATEDIRDPESVLHDTVSYLLLATVSCLLVMEPGAAARLRQLTWQYAVLGTLFMIVLLANAWGYFGVPGVQPWFWERLQGWSENPNQLALECASLVLTSLYLAESVRGVMRRLAALSCAILPIYVGRLSGSDTFLIILVAAGPVFFALKWRTWLAQATGSITLRAAFSWLIVLMLPLVLGYAVILAPTLASETQGLFGYMKGGGKEESGESKLRFELWSEAVSRGVQSGLIGLGPGAHLVSTAYKRVPPPNFEAHNTTLDLFTQGGLLAVVGFLGLLLTAVRRTIRVNLAGLTTLLCGLALFSSFHLIVRHPIFWFSIALCLVAPPARAPDPLLRHGS